MNDVEIRKLIEQNRRLMEIVENLDRKVNSLEEKLRETRAFSIAFSTLDHPDKETAIQEWCEIRNRRKIQEDNESRFLR